MKQVLTKSLLIIINVFLLSCAIESETEKNALKDVLISAHRSGPSAGFPENALETLQNTAKVIKGVMLEIDVLPTQDNKLILMHDMSLDRTTTSKGLVKENTLKAIKSAFLLDENGTPTSMKVPTLVEVLHWVNKNNAFLSIDVKDKNTFKMIIDLISEYQLEDRVEIITYNIDDAELIHNYNSNIYISMSIGNENVLNRVLNTNINTKKVSAYTGNTLKGKSFYNTLKDHHMSVTLGTMGNLDNKALANGFDLFLKWKKLGIDRFATDYPFEVYKILKN